MTLFTENSLQIKLTPNFSLSEFVTLTSINQLTLDIYTQICYLAQRLQVVRDTQNKPVRITSGWRTFAHNKQVGGARHSYHLKGMAADIQVLGMSSEKVQAFLESWSGGMGCYSTFTHLDIRPNRVRW